MTTMALAVIVQGEVVVALLRVLLIRRSLTDTVVHVRSSYVPSFRVHSAIVCYRLTVVTACVRGQP